MTNHETSIHNIVAVEYNARSVWNTGKSYIVKLVAKDDNGNEFKFSLFTSSNKLKLKKNKEL